jgi:hypothetical protein
MLLKIVLTVFSGMLFLRVLITVGFEAKAGIDRPRLAIGELTLPLAAGALALLAGTDMIALNRYAVLGIGVLLVADGLARWGLTHIRAQE